MSVEHTIFVLVGPTASGKSAAAIDVARRRNGVIINADAMQMYHDLQIITARPTVAEMSDITHRLYGVLDATDYGNAALWCEMVKAEIEAVWAEGKLPMLVGGTGMYIQSLMQGMATIAPIDEAVRTKVRAQWNQDAAASYTALQQHDPDIADRLAPADGQRIMRALEVFYSSGRPLSAWQADETRPAFPDATYQCHYIDRPRDELYARIDTRFDQMMQQGALSEVEALMEKLALKTADIYPDYPILKSHGVPELIAHLWGQMTLEEAIIKAQQNTRNYAKRQMTWVRWQFKGAKPLHNSS